MPREAHERLMASWASCYEDHVIMRERLLKLMRRDDELISASLRALSETRELLARIDDMLDR
jgi:hypothetical protein